MKGSSDKLISLREAAEISGLSADFLRLYAKRGRFPAQRIGSQYVVPESWAHTIREVRCPPPGYVTIAEAKKIAGVSRERIHQLIKLGRVRAESRVLFERSVHWVERVSLEQWMRERDGHV